MYPSAMVSRLAFGWLGWKAIRHVLEAVNFMPTGEKGEMVLLLYIFVYMMAVYSAMNWLSHRFNVLRWI